MRSYVCGQCHVTYYFQPPNKRLTFPWSKGLKVENIIAVEDEQKINEWTHPDSGASMIKARHPEFEMWNQGVHAR
jgi:nitrite reductase (cytochrome c-552)